MKKRRLAILGSTGSIGRQALDVVRQHRDCFDIELLTANNNAGLLAAQAREFDANCAVICNPDKYPEAVEALGGTDTKVFAGMDSVCDLVAGDNIDMVLTATVGFSGLRPTIAAIDAGKTLALANKETLVAGGSLVMERARKKGAAIIPVDSEHSAVFQCLMGAAGNRLRRIHLTASGGPFRTWDRAAIARATPQDALRHPRWNMGDKITIDSATMMNKGFEMIEARWLFDMAPEDIRIVIHPESVIHSLIEFDDGAILAQLAVPDMRQPIQFALAFPERLPLDGERLDLAALGSLTFREPDPERFPATGLAFEAIGRGGNLPCVLNAANEAAVEAFLHGRLPFYGITDIVRSCLEEAAFIATPTLDDIFATHADTLGRADEIIRHYR